jgi:hypothetical protein
MTRLLDFSAANRIEVSLTGVSLTQLAANWGGYGLK